MNLKQYQKQRQLPDFETLKHHRRVQVSKNPSNLEEFINVNKKYTQRSTTINQRDVLTDKFLKELSEQNQLDNYTYTPNEHFNSLLVHRNPLFTKKQHQIIH